MDTPFRYEALRPLESFEQVSDPAVYAPLPDDWLVGVTDVVDSTRALRAGRYKAVNMAGAAVVSAVMNALDQAGFPFVFGGDGTILAVPAEAASRTKQAMAETARFVERELGLDLRVGALEVRDIRAAGHDVRVARYAASPNALYAMFSGGGASWIEGELKAGRIGLPPAPDDARPDLAGLSCRWRPLQSRRGVILSLLALPAEGGDTEAFRRLAREVIALGEGEERGGHPVDAEGPRFAIVPAGLMMEADMTRAPAESRWSRFGRIAGQMGLAMAFDRLGGSIGRFDPRRYRAWVARNSDFRKFEDGLRMTLDCSPATADRLEALLASAEKEGVVDYGVHRQDAALMTCIVPSFLSDDHLHFLDGAGGGYALSAAALKDRQAQRRGAASAA